ncbi:MAG: hypothetical protein ACREXJ_10815 [Gammaproteobacteria bacterium]
MGPSNPATLPDRVTALSRIDVTRLLDFGYDRKGLFKGMDTG